MESIAFPVFVISLDRSADRRLHVEEQLRNSWKGPWEIFAAVDGLALDISVFRRLGLIREVFNRQMIGGEIGCWLSHLFLLDAIADRELEMAMILEDDVVLPAGIQDELAERLELLKEAGIEWDVCFAGSYSGTNWAPKAPTELLPGGFFRMDAETRGAPGSWAYLVTLAGARKLTNRMCRRLIDRPTDEIFPEMCIDGLTVICASPSLVEPSGHSSTILEECDPAPSAEYTERCLRSYLALVFKRGCVGEASSRDEPA